MEKCILRTATLKYDENGKQLITSVYLSLKYACIAILKSNTISDIETLHLINENNFLDLDENYGILFLNS